MWKVRETPRIGVKVFYEVYKIKPSGDIVSRGMYPYKTEAQTLADKLNEEEGFNERIF